MERVSPGTVFFYALPYGSRAYGAALIGTTVVVLLFQLPRESTKPRLHFCSFLISGGPEKDTQPSPELKILIYKETALLGASCRKATQAMTLLGFWQTSPWYR